VEETLNQLLQQMKELTGRLTEPQEIIAAKDAHIGTLKLRKSLRIPVSSGAIQAMHTKSSKGKATLGIAAFPPAKSGLPRS